MRGAGLFGRAAAFVLAACLFAGCAPVRKPTPAPSLPEVDLTYVAVGAPSALGFEREVRRDAWTYRFHREALPLGAVFYDLGAWRATAQAILDEHVPDALRLEPDVVTVWLRADDAIADVPAEEHERRLTDLLRQLRRGGRTAVLVSNVPPLVARPGPSSTADDVVGARVASYNEALARAAAAEGAVVVDLHSASADLPDGRDLVMSSGLGRAAIDHERLAELFAAAAEQAGVERPRTTATPRRDAPDD